MIDVDICLYVTIPLVPGQETSPNWRGSWQGRYRATKALREAACFCSVDALARGSQAVPVPSEGEIGLRWSVFWPKGRHATDDDNLTAMLKPARDGIADALGVDDRRFRTLSVDQFRAEGDGYVQVALVRRSEA